MILTDPRTGLKYKSQRAQRPTEHPCDLCDLRENCDEEMCRYWREISTITITGLVRTYFKRVE